MISFPVSTCAHPHPSSISTVQMPGLQHHAQTVCNLQIPGMEHDVLKQLKRDASAPSVNMKLTLYCVHLLSSFFQSMVCSIPVPQSSPQPLLGLVSVHSNDSHSCHSCLTPLDGMVDHSRQLKLSTIQDALSCWSGSQSATPGGPGQT